MRQAAPRDTHFERQACRAGNGTISASLDPLKAQSFPSGPRVPASNLIRSVMDAKATSAAS